MAGVIEGSRCALLGTQSPAMWIIALNAIVVLVLLLGGLLYFRQTEKTFAKLCLSFPGVRGEYAACAFATSGCYNSPGNFFVGMHRRTG